MINTQGHQFQVMPQYTSVDPNRVTFNPAGLTEGALSSINLFNELDKRKAYLQQQQDLAALRENSLGATNAQNLATIQLAPQRNIADIALAQQQAAVIPGQTEATLADQSFNQYLRPLVQNVNRQKAETADLLSAQRADREIKQAALDDAEQARQAELAPVQGELTLAKARDALASITEDKKMSDAEKLAHIRNLNASAASSEANAAFTERNRPVNKNQNVIDESQKQLGHIEMSIRRLEAQKVQDPNADNKGLPVPIQQYQAATRGPDGKLIINTHFFGPDTVMKTNPMAENVSTQLNNLYKLREKYTNDLTSALANDAGVPISAPETIAASPAGTAIPANAVQYLKNNPGLRGAFDAKYGSGASASILGK